MMSLLLLASCNASTQTTGSYKNAPEYQAEYEAFVEDYNKALEVILNSENNLSKQEQQKVDKQYKLLMDQAKAHFQKLIDMTPEGDEKNTMQKMLEQLQVD